MNDGPWTEPQRRGRMYFKNAETGEVVEMPGPTQIEISYPIGGYLDNVEFTLREPGGVTIPMKLCASRRTLAAIGFMPPYRFKRAGRSRRKRASR